MYPCGCSYRCPACQLAVINALFGFSYSTPSSASHTQRPLLILNALFGFSYSTPSSASHTQRPLLILKRGHDDFYYYLITTHHSNLSIRTHHCNLNCFSGTHLWSYFVINWLPRRGLGAVPPATSLKKKKKKKTGAFAAMEGEHRQCDVYFLSYDLLIEGLARQWVACSEGHSPKSRRTCRVDT
jgi:hypothetical protein